MKKLIELLERKKIESKNVEQKLLKDGYDAISTIPAAEVEMFEEIISILKKSE